MSSGTITGSGFAGFAAFALVTGAICHQSLGEEVFVAVFVEDLRLVADMALKMLAAVMLAGLVWVLLPRDSFTRLVGRNSGLLGLLIATVAGVVTPGGPSAAYMLPAVVGASGGDRGVMVAYITSWALLGLQRILIWDLPLMGPEFTSLRFLISFPLSILAGLIARKLPLSLTLKRLSDPTDGARPETGKGA